MDAVSYAHSAKQAQRIEKFIKNPDSTSGVLTQPSVIQAGETVTVPIGRTAILANTQIDGTLNIEGEVFIPSGATFDGVLEKRSIVAGTVRQDPTDRTKWLFISDSEHTPIGVSGTYGVATGNSLVINFDKTYSKVISFVIAPDETLAISMGMTVGASVGLDKVTINASVHTNIVAKIYWNGTTWVIENLDGQNGNVQFSSYINGSLTITHTYCKGASYSLNAWTQGNAIYPYIPVIRNTGEDAVSIFFMDTTTGQFVSTPTPSTKMSFVFSKQSNTRQIRLDGTDSATIINNADIASGNFWFYGIFEE